MYRLIIALLLLLGSVQRVQSQETFHPNGVADETEFTHAFVHAKIHIDHQTVLENATLIIKGKKIIATGTDIEIPKNAVVHELGRKYIYPAFIDLHSSYGMPKIPKGKKSSKKALFNSPKGTALGWNMAVKPEVSAANLYEINEEDALTLLENGFGAVLTGQRDGVVRGTNTLVELTIENEHESILIENASTEYSLNKGMSVQNYPTSRMGAIALLRQTNLDAQWYDQAKVDQTNLSLEAFNRNKKYPTMAFATNYLDVLRLDKIGDEFGEQYILGGGGDEYKRIAELKATNALFVIPIDFEKAFKLEDPMMADIVELGQLKSWEMEPFNPSILAKENIEFAISTKGHKGMSKFWEHLRKAVECGLSEEDALRSLTSTPAKMLNAEDQIGSLQKDRRANFFIASGNIFTEEETIIETWVAGTKFEFSDQSPLDIRGDYTLKLDKEYILNVKGKLLSPKGEIVINDTTTKDVTIKTEGKNLLLSFDLDEGKTRLNATVDSKSKDWIGTGVNTDGQRIQWEAKFTKVFKEEEKKAKKEKKAPSHGDILFPNKAYGFKEVPSLKDYLITNITVWTCEEEGNLKYTSVKISKGKIVEIGKDLKETEGITIIDGTGKHLTPGFVDEHSHIGVSGAVNEWSESVTSEVRIGDVLNPEDISIYYQLAGGTTTSQILHGSANCIGGQSALIKLRWGSSAEELKIKNADGFIKFALGENVIKSSGTYNTNQFPRTRSGVEQLDKDAFIRAQEYLADWKNYNALSSKGKENKIMPRKDLELDALGEILNKKRFITCHSYVQSEINMLMHLADTFGFKINTFTHILEGYKIADKMKAHGAGASTFADWWAYKKEVMDAIPQNAKILHKEGVVVALNSDDDNEGSNLNLLAAKVYMYGGLTQEESLNMITINPAKLLHLDNRIGSIVKGKDADLVIWDGNPLSIYSTVLKTFIDGKCYYDKEDDVVRQEEIQKERTRIINKMMGGDSDEEEKQDLPLKDKNKKVDMCMDVHNEIE
ncbi:MAG: amidohydrolase family protein [Flavobacteriales bacterium]|nr:amidohydrolase family protein [Flavobacteriales bacterium]